MAKKSIGIILFLLFLVWSFFNISSRIFLRSDATDVIILDNYNIAWLGYLVYFFILILNFAAIIYIFKPKNLGLKVIYIYLSLQLFMVLLTFSLGMANLDLLTDAVIQSREGRGLSVEGIDMLVNPIFLSLTVFITIAFYTFLIFYIHRKRKYFTE